MLNIGRMAPGSHDYYLAVVVSGVEDYYLARGEAPGRWLGSGADSLDLRGDVAGPELARVLAGDDPATGSRLAAHPARKVPGFDLTFRPPKSVSLLWGLTDRSTATEVQDAHDAAVAAAVGYLEREAGWTRRGAGGAETVKADGFIAAAFRHRTSRAGDPLLHTHVLVANLARTSDDGVWRTLDSRRLYAHAKTAGALYQAHLRHELTRRLGVAFARPVNGYADLVDVPREWIDGFSQRRAQILAHMTERGEASAKAAQVATLETRSAKEPHVSEAELRARWADRSRELGIQRDWWRRLLGRAQPERPDVMALYQDLVVDERLTAHESTFAMRDVLQQVAGALPSGASVEHIEDISRALVGHDPEQVLALGATRGRLRTVDVIRPDNGNVVPADADEPRFTTRGLLLTEQRAIHRAVNRTREGIAVVGHPQLPDGLSDEQAAMVERLTTSGAGVEVVVGKAGTGKTFALDAARRIWTDAGIEVRGVALAARAARELECSAGIPSTTIARLLSQATDGWHGSPLRPGSVLVVDEAGMVGTRQLARLLDHAQSQRVKVVLVGDPHQLPEIDAGGLFTALAVRLPSVELMTNRRQRNEWERDALDHLRSGTVNDAIKALQANGRIVTSTDAEAVREELVADWWQHFDDLHGATSAVMIALRRGDVDDLNMRARARLAAAGALTGRELEIDGVPFQAGDRVICRRNDRRIGVVNGTAATVIDADPDQRCLRVVDDTGSARRLPASYLDAGHVTHGYAITGHKAQGLTVDHTFVLGSQELYREWGYVALSRGRESNRLYVHPGARPDPDLDVHHHEPHADPISTVSSRLDRSRAQTSVSDDIARIAAARWRELGTRLMQPGIMRQRELAEQHDRLVQQRDRTSRGLDRAVERLDQLGRVRQRKERADLQERVISEETALGHLDHQIWLAATELARLPDGAWIADARDELRELTRQIHTRAVASADVAIARPPRHLLTSLGAPPDDRHRRESWHQAAIAVEQYRLRWGVDDADRPLGQQPTEPHQADDYHRALDQISATRRELTREHEAPGHVRVRSL
jgi:conjugative relaxase-like TrwC/TraI family protein